MKIKDLPNALPLFFDAGVAVEVGSPPGCGKSESIDQIVKKLSERDGFEWGISKVFIATLSPVDINGYLVPGVYQHQKEDGTVENVRTSEFTMPPWMLSVTGRPMNHYKRGIVVFEEWDKGDPDTKKASAEVLLNGRAGNHAVHPGIARVSLVNRAEDRSGSTKNFDFIINRRTELTLSADLGGWMDWALQNGVDPLFVGFADKFPEIVFNNKIPEKQEPFCTPRSLVLLSKVFNQHRDAKGNIKADTLASEIAAGMIGHGAAAQLLSWFKLRNETPSLEQILKDPDGTPVPEKPDAKMMVCYELAHKVEKSTASKIVAYIKRFPAEFAVTFAKAACRRDFTLVNEASFASWVAKNASLLNAIGGAR
jgi:hypothetical protein